MCWESDGFVDMCAGKNFKILPAQMSVGNLCTGDFDRYWHGVADRWENIYIAKNGEEPTKRNSDPGAGGRPIQIEPSKLDPGEINNT